MECELWPGLIFESRRWNVPMIAVTGSYTERAQTRDKARFGVCALGFGVGATRRCRFVYLRR